MKVLIILIMIITIIIMIILIIPFSLIIFATKTLTFDKGPFPPMMYKCNY